MSHKIVQTWENNKYRLFTVPSTWEDKNILKYPKKNVTKYLQMGTSIPEHDWKQIKCEVKRRELPSYETAEYVLQEMVNHTDTEDDIANATTSKQSKPELNLNIIADDIVNLYPNIHKNVRNTNTYQENAVTYHHDVVLKQKNTNTTTVGAPTENLNTEVSYEYVIPMCNNEDNVNVDNLETLITGQNTLLVNQTKILEQLNFIQNVQATTIQKIASLSVQLDHAMIQINNLPQNLQVTPLSACKSSPSNTAFDIKPIETVQQLDQLEQGLSDSANRQQKKKLYSVIFSSGKGIDCAYTLADVLFSRKFLCQCSWSGGSRGNNDAKIAWKTYKNILSFFWEMVHTWDNKYTVSHNVEFFQNILKNAKKRNMAKKERASTSRKRIKRSKNQSVNDEIESDEEKTSVTTAKKAKLMKKQIETNPNNDQSSIQQYVDRRSVIEEKIEEKKNDKESANNSDSKIEGNECRVEEKDHEKRNDYETSENVESTFEENVNTEEEDEDHEREGDTSNDKENTVDSDESSEKNDITQNKIEEEQENNKDKINCPNSSITKNIIEETEKKTFKEKIERNKNEKVIKENEEDPLKEINKEKESEITRKENEEKIDSGKNYEKKNAEILNSINVKMAEKNNKLEEELNSEIGEKERKDKEREIVHGRLKPDCVYTNKENKNIVKNQKKEDRGLDAKSKKYMKNKNWKEKIIKKSEK
ncbi:hypothetical protein O0L34_g11050 [Tuta absoluta]|nr:hypothetical protein O0L34_g11050 [Tuta absoluta]